jgi:hypothetical protein
MTESLDDLTTEELRDRAIALAERRRDLRFFWDLARHLPQAAVLAAEDGSPGHIFGSIEKAVEAVRQLFGDADLGELEPLFRARFLDYLKAHPAR